MGRIKWSDKKIKEMIKEGVGSGYGIDYKPWIHVTGGGSEGKLIRPKGWKTGRAHQFLSQLEYHTFLAFDWNDAVIDIREQYPLKRNETEKIAEDLGIKHPKYPSTDVNIVMTTDMIITFKLQNGKQHYEAISVKPSSGLEDKRTIEKLEIEKTYWKNLDVKWQIVTEKEINRTFIQNIEWIHNYQHLQNEFNTEDIVLLANNLILDIGNSDDSLYSSLHSFGYHNNLQIETVIAILRYCLANKMIELNMFQLIQLNKTMTELI